MVKVDSETLFGLRRRGGVFRRRNIRTCRTCRMTRRGRVLRGNTTFRLVGTFLRLGGARLKELIRIVVVSQGGTGAYLHVFGSVRCCKLSVAETALADNTRVTPCLGTFGASLFLSTGSISIRSTVGSKVTTNHVLANSTRTSPGRGVGRVHVTFSKSTMLFSTRSRGVFRGGKVRTFRRRRGTGTGAPVTGNPFTGFLAGLSCMRRVFGRGRVRPVQATLIASEGTPTRRHTIGALHG